TGQDVPVVLEAGGVELVQGLPECFLSVGSRRRLVRVVGEGVPCFAQFAQAEVVDEGGNDAAAGVPGHQDVKGSARVQLLQLLHIGGEEGLFGQDENRGHPPSIKAGGGFVLVMGRGRFRAS